MSKKNIKQNNVNVEEVVENNIEETTPITGIVSNCDKLNVRKEASDKADVLTVIKKDTNVVIDKDESPRGWYKVSVNNISGYCMKKYISIKS